MIKINNITKKYRRRTVFKDFSLSLPEKGIFIIQGPNGSGKSTLLRLISGLERTTKGEIVRPKPFFSRSGFVLGEELYTPFLSFYDMMLLVGKLKKISKEDIINRIAFFSKVFNLPSDDQLILDYSDGMKKKVALSLSLIHHPQFLFWDEPFAFLDQQTVNYLCEEIISDKKLFVIASHSRAVLEKITFGKQIINLSL